MPDEVDGSFLVSGFGNSEDGYMFLDLRRPIDASYRSLVLKKGSGFLDYCLVADIVSGINSSKIELTPTVCTTKRGVICKKRPYRCAAELAKDSNGNLKLQMDPDLVEERDRLAGPKLKNMKELFQRLDKTKASEALFRMMWYSNMPCFDVYGITAQIPYESSIIKACYWKGKKISCAAVFSPIPTDRGMCCSFKMKPMDEIFNSKTYVDLAMDLQNYDKKSAFMDTTIPEWFKNDTLTQPGEHQIFGIGIRFIMTEDE